MSKHWDQYTVLRAGMVGYTQAPDSDFQSMFQSTYTLQVLSRHHHVGKVDCRQLVHTVVQSSCPNMNKHWEQYSVLHVGMVGYTQLQISMQYVYISELLKVTGNAYAEKALNIKF